MFISGILMILSPLILNKLFNLSLLPFEKIQRMAKALGPYK